MEKLSVSIIMSAYNEAENIANIIGDIMRQTQDNYILKDIIIVTDGCTDTTADIIRNLHNTYIHLIEHKERRGKAPCIYEATQLSTADIHIQIDADTRWKHDHTISELIAPFLADPHVGLTCGNNIALPPHNFVSKIAYTGLSMYRDLVDQLGDKAIRYRCNGRLFAIRSDIAKTIKIPGDISTDVYTFYSVIQANKKVVYCPNAITYYLITAKWKEYVQQHTRYMKNEIRLHFPDVYKPYHVITFRTRLAHYVTSLLRRKYPFYIIITLMVIYLTIKINALFMKRTFIWKISPSTKQKITLPPSQT
jgi:glycosyltransferase involved in cell wall biosynthesis